MADQTIDYMYVLGSKGLYLYKFKQHLCFTVYDGTKDQIFYTEIGNYVYRKDEEKVYELTHDNWTRMVLKIECYFNESTIGYAGDLKP